MDYKEKFEELVQEKKYEDARILLERKHIHALEEPFYYANMGWIYNQMERYEEAIVYLKKGLSLFPGDGWMYSQIGYAYDRLDRVEEGLEAIRTAFRLGFDEPWLHAEKGWCYKELEEYETAINCFEDALMDDENNVWFLAQAAYTYMALNRDIEAEEYFLKCYRLQPTDDSLYDLIHFYKHKQDYHKVIQYLEHETKEEFEGWRVLELGLAYNELQDYQQAASYLEKALSHGKDDTNIRSILGDVYAQLDRKEESDAMYHIALDYYEKALLREEEEQREWIWQEMIWIAHKQKEFMKKLEYLDRASKEYPDNLWMQYHYARCYSDLNQHGKAAQACETCISLGENGKEMLDLYAWNLGRCDQEQKAIEVLEERISTFGADEWNYGEIGWDYAQLKEYDKALLYFHKAADKNPDNEMHMSMMGWCYLRIKDYDQALIYLEKAKSLGRNDGWINSVLGETYAAIHDIEKAIAHYEYAIKHDYDEEWIHLELKELKDEKDKQQEKG